MQARGRAAALLLAATAVVVTSGCESFSELQFHVDHRLHITSPKEESTVHSQNVTITWTMKDFTEAGPGAGPVNKDTGYFALFLDQAAIKPGQSLGSKDSSAKCGKNPTCPSQSDLNNLNIYTTTNNSFTITGVPASGTAVGKYDEHDVVVVLMNTAGKRIGESSWEVDFKLPKQSF